jgi:hypothetical protein
MSYTRHILDQVSSRLDVEFLYQNQNGGLDLSGRALTEFRELTPDIVWERGARMQRRRQFDDLPGGKRGDQARVAAI